MHTITELFDQIAPPQTNEPTDAEARFLDLKIYTKRNTAEHEFDHLTQRQASPADATNTP